MSNSTSTDNKMYYIEKEEEENKKNLLENKNKILEENIHYVSPSNEAIFIRSLPVLFIIILVAALYCIFVLYHCIPLLQIDVAPEERDGPSFDRGLGELIAFNVLVILFIISYLMSIFTPPGSIPDEDEWKINLDDFAEQNNSQYSALPAETKRKGGKRWCKWCIKYKPDRSHHCRVCRKCILRMDHHCPWIYNCVGYFNHKYFILSLIYSLLLSLFIAIAMFESVKKALDQPVVPFGQMFLLLFGETLDLFLGIIVLAFFFFHMWLVSNGMTTIEFCEKQAAWGYPSRHLWNRGCWQNFLDVFGSNPLLWFLPIDNRHGDGVNFISESTCLLSDLENTEFLHYASSSAIPTKNGKQVIQFEPIIDDESVPSLPREEERL